jgi:hypothetical protein
VEACQNGTAEQHSIKYGSFLTLLCFPIKIYSDITLLTKKYHDKKRAACFFQRESLCIKGKNPALGIFPKAIIYTKQPKIKTGLPDDLWYTDCRQARFYLCLDLNRTTAVK